jgi:hypothetical protein
MKTIAIIELNRWGHHEVYLKFTIEALLELDYQVVALCPYPSEIKEWIALKAPKHSESLYCYQLQEERDDEIALAKQSGVKRRLNSWIKTKPLLVTIKRWHYAATCLHAASSKFGLTPDLVFFTYLDNYLGSYLARYILDYIFPYKWSGLYVLPFHLRDLNFVLDKPHALLRSPNCQAVAVLDEGIANKLQTSIIKPVIVFPDFADTTQPDREFQVAKQIKEEAQGRKIITLIGALEKRKGFLRMLEVSQIMRSENYFFVFAGGFREGSFTSEEATTIKSIVKSQPSNCFFHFDYVPDEAKYNALIEVSDVLWVVYDFPHSAQTLTKAAFFEKLVLVSSDTCTSERVQKFKTGISVDKDSTIDCVDGIRKLNDRLETNDDSSILPNYEGYKYIHSTQQLKLKLMTLLKPAIKDHEVI